MPKAPMAAQNLHALPADGAANDTDALPEPLTDKSCDMSGTPWMPLYGNKLIQSDFYSQALAQPRGGWAALKLWWVAWQRIPAGSLPNDDRVLPRHADFGSDLRAWMRHRSIALHGFILCSDGNLYHPVICELALKASVKRAKDTARKQAQRRNLASECQDEAGEPQIDDTPAADESHKPLINRGVRSDVPRDRAWDGERRAEKKRPEKRRKKESYALPKISDFGDAASSLSGGPPAALFDVSEPFETSKAAMPPRMPIAEAVEMWNQMVAVKLGRGRVTKMTEPRKRHLAARFHELGGTLEDWRGYLRRITHSPFLMDPKNGWFGFDWAINEANAVKISEGNYDQQRAQFADAVAPGAM
jgi:hypothetical protein